MVRRADPSRLALRSFAVVALAGLALMAACGRSDIVEHGLPPVCIGVRCSNHGRCVDAGGAAGCVCDPGYDPAGQECLPSSCAALPDLSRCNTADPPGFSYDLCIDQGCASPGCGTPGCNPPGPGFAIPDTSVTLCYDAAGVLGACPQSGEPFYGQDAQVGWDVLHPSVGERFVRHVFGAAEEPVVTDAVTGLMWLACVVGRGGAGCANLTGSTDGFTFDRAHTECEDLVWSGFDDWRVPDPFEARSIIDFEVPAPALDAGVFPGIASGLWAWTSATAQWDGTGWVVYLGSGGLSRGYGKTNLCSVRCVRTDHATVPLPLVRYEVDTASDRTVRDSRTGLLWQGCPAGMSGSSCAVGAAAGFDWQGALAYCDSLDWGGRSNWRLPNLNELLSLADIRTPNSPDAATDTTAFVGTPPSPFWSGTSRRGQVAPNAWVLDFAAGKDADADKSVVAPLVRCVTD
ncbi:MAG: DUF1566 domain-containing protein [Deltaproteobacteria bacterium]|nr:DUF1566 domain-containing protein [Deltaproteobacteria bacterium]